MACGTISLIRKSLIASTFAMIWGLFSFPFSQQDCFFANPLHAQIGIDFNQEESSGTLNLTAHYRMYNDIGDIVPADQSSLLFSLNGYFWLSSVLSVRFNIGLGFPLVNPENLDSVSTAQQSLFFYDGELGMRFTLLKASSLVMMLGVLMDTSEGHIGNIFLFDSKATSSYLQTGLGLEMEMAFALGLEYLFYFRLKVPISTYNATFGAALGWGFYPRQGSLELAFLFHKGPSFGLSKAARNIYFGPFYRFGFRVLALTPAKFVISHTIGVTYYIKPPF